MAINSDIKAKLSLLYITIILYELELNNRFKGYA